MRKITPLSLETARALIDFRGNDLISPAMAERQLRGTVALHNILAREGLAYLADEVGLGKTYVALGVVALMRFIYPDFRVLYIAPRENIQHKWVKELRNFTSHNWRYRDQRVRTLQDTPAKDFVVCENLLEWARQSVRNANRDFFLRLTSFSFGLSDDRSSWKKKRSELMQVAPFIEKADMDLRGQDKVAFKRAYARNVNKLLPCYDLVIVDEAHNLKHGAASRTSRNQLFIDLLGSRPLKREVDQVAPSERRFERVLLLSATPLESDYAELWRQLDLFGFGNKVLSLNDSGAEEKEKEAATARFMIRRLNALNINGKSHTKNMYRREWRGGGVEAHDQPLDVPDARQRLIVALVQKKVAEILNSPRFGASFQIGMLASFESFLQTAKVSRDEDQANNFDQTDQTDDDLEKQGADVLVVNRLAQSYRRRFGAPLPHPKMDTVIKNLAPVFDKGEKSLVFVRRVMSVPEMREKLSRAYDHWIESRLFKMLPPELHEEIRQVFHDYREMTLRRVAVTDDLQKGGFRSPVNGDRMLVDEQVLREDAGGNDSFFSWFFRGDGPGGINSGANFRQNRLLGEGSAYSTFFEDNYLTWLLETRDDVLGRLATEVKRSPGEVAGELRAHAFRIVASGARKKKWPRLQVFRAYQEAGLRLLKNAGGPHGEKAEIVLHDRFGSEPERAAPELMDGFPDHVGFLEARTFFTELRLRPGLRDRLWPAPAMDDSRRRFRDRLWPAPAREVFRRGFREQECRRMLQSAVARLGHAYIPLWALGVTRIGSLQLKAQERSRDRAETLINDYLDLLERQKDEPGFNAYRELSLVSDHHDLVLSINFPLAKDDKRTALSDLPRLFGQALGHQVPVGGMSGKVNARLVGQFRMPGYPLVLITTDVLQEGEDLHTFCSNVIHYGITWTPSAMEQRTGRIDRIGSQVHRSLECLERPAQPGELLQVYYPYLGDTVEKLQVNKVFHRMNDFIRLLHRGHASKADDSRVKMNDEILKPAENIAPFDTPLVSAFPIVKTDLEGEKRHNDHCLEQVAAMIDHFSRMTTRLEKRIRLRRSRIDSSSEWYGSVVLNKNELMTEEDIEPQAIDHKTYRIQPLALQLRTSSCTQHTLLHGISPVGKIALDDETTLKLALLQDRLNGAKICHVPWEDEETYSITVEGDILFSPETTQFEEVLDLVKRITVGADLLERTFLKSRDESLDTFLNDMRKEARRGSD